ncbi:MAG: hypothetical protein ACREM8_04285 [Vulcanimicrobiaceae bacterium]
MPRQLTGLLAEVHKVATVVECGWGGITNGALLRAADSRFDVLLTADQGIDHQQSFVGVRIATVVLPTNRLREVIEAVPALFQTLGRIEARQHVIMDLGPRPDGWRQLRLHAVVEEAGVLRHVFR